MLTITNIKNINFLQSTTNKIPFKGSETNRKDGFGIDIISSAEFPINYLSNFSETDFEFDGVHIGSIEGFLQSLKVRDTETQEKICAMSGKYAKGMGKKYNKLREYDFKNLYWKGKPINREKPEYRELLKRVYEAKFENDEGFRFALEYTKGRVLRHSIGGQDPKRTLLTEKEFTDILTEIRKEHFGE